MLFSNAVFGSISIPTEYQIVAYWLFSIAYLPHGSVPPKMTGFGICSPDLFVPDLECLL